MVRGTQVTSMIHLHSQINGRAWVIYMGRQRIGLAGDADSDWLEAEKQLSEEARKARSKFVLPDYARLSRDT